MKIEKIAISHGATINIEHFESKRVDIEMVAMIEKGDDYKKEYDQLKEEIMQKVNTWEQEIRSKVCNEEKKLDTSKIETGGQDGKKFICPKCGEEMIKKEGKDYYLCSKHWGYPDMIKEGTVRDKKFI